jgi:hypothetical protein
LLAKKHRFLTLNVMAFVPTVHYTMFEKALQGRADPPGRGAVHS